MTAAAADYESLCTGRTPAAQRRKYRGAVAQAAGLVLGLAAAAGAQDDPASASPLEHALVEYLCKTVHRPSTIGTEGYQACYGMQLSGLRRQFGRDLAKLTPADRKALDAACGRMQALGDRDAYLGCLHRQLGVMRERHGRGAAQPQEDPDGLVPPELEPLVEVIPPPLPIEPPRLGGVWWIVLVVTGLVTAGGAAFTLMRTRRAPHACRGCGAAVDGAGDMCATCRHEAAEARRRAIAERAEEERLQQEKARRDAELLDEEARREQARLEETMRLKAEEEQRRRDEQARRLERARAEEAAAEQAFDPFAVLGVAPDAGPDAVRAAYEQAKRKYDPREYEHLGVELQDHFKRKAAAVERAYEMLAGPAAGGGDQASGAA